MTTSYRYDAPGCTVRDIHDNCAVIASLGGGAWGEAVQLTTPGRSPYYTLNPEGAERLGNMLLALATAALKNRKRQRAASAAFIAQFKSQPEPKGERELERATRLRKQWEKSHPSLKELKRAGAELLAMRLSQDVELDPKGHSEPSG